MKLPGIPFLKKKDPTEFLLILLLRKEKANAVIVQKIGGSLKVLNAHEEFFSTDLEAAADTEWLDILDTAISRAEEKLPPNIQTHNTIFGLPNSWIEEKQIKKEYLSRLKTASDALELSPIGFIEIPEAICHLLQEQEGAPISALITEIGNKHISISLARGGRIIETKSAPIRESAVVSVDTLLKEFDSVDVLPSRIIVYNGKNTDELSQMFLSHHWSKSIQFLHMPKITILPSGFDVSSIIKGAAEQLGVSILGQFGAEMAQSIKTVQPSNDHLSSSENIAGELRDETTDNIESTGPESFGFVVGKDISTLPENEKPSIPMKSEVSTQEEPTDPKHSEKESETTHEPEFATQHQPINRDDHDNLREPSFQDDSQPEEQLPEGKKRFAVPHFTLPFTIPGLKTLFSGGNTKVKNKLLLLGPLLLIILIGLIIAYTSFASATINVEVKPDVAEKEENIVFSMTGPNDFSDNVIQAKTTKLKLSGTVSTPATGTKEEGEKAKGTITVFNSSSGKKELAEGTVVKASNGLEFVLDKSVIIASASGDIFSGTQSGTAKVPITAVEIGKESNLPSNSTFTLESDGQVAAKNEEAFSGGSSTEITVVSEEDIAKLTEELPESLTKKAEDQINEKLSKNETLLTISSNFKPLAKDFNATEGEEAETVTLNAVVEFTGIYYDNTDLIEFTKTVLKNEFAQDQTIDEAGIRNTLTDIILNEDDDAFTAILAIEADLLPKIDREKLKKELAGKSFDVVNGRFERLPQVQSTTISLFPPIPLIPQILPRNPEKIEIIVDTI